MRFLKALAFVLVLAVTAGGLSLWYDTVLRGEYLATSGVFLAILAISAPAFLIVAALVAIRAIAKYNPKSNSNFSL